jgi:hypothetical protein
MLIVFVAFAIAVSAQTLGGGITDLYRRGKSFPKEVLDRIVRRTDRVPLFVEELTAST